MTRVTWSPCSATAPDEMGFALPASAAVRSYCCGKDNCACHGDPPHQHGPPIRGTRKVDSKTANLMLSEEHWRDYEAGSTKPASSGRSPARWSASRSRSSKSTAHGRSGHLAEAVSPSRRHEVEVRNSTWLILLEFSRHCSCRITVKRATSLVVRFSADMPVG
jgi:hypothetical protein